MSNFLWVEDFEGSLTNGETFKAMTDAVFGKELGNINEINTDDLEDYLEQENIYLELTFLSALEFIRDKDRLSKIDFIILDVDLMLKMKGDTDEHNYLPEILENYQQIASKTPEIALKETAGYQLYVELVLNLDFPKDHILFCSNHGDQLDSIKQAFQNAKIYFPNDRLFTKNENEKLYNWISPRRHNPYYVLRRSIIAGCQYIKEQCEEKEDFFQFDKMLNKSADKDATKNDFLNQLELLKRLLPLREPAEAEKKHLYKVVLRTLAHEWDKADNDKLKNKKEQYIYTFGSTLKNIRNWSAHTTLLDKPEEKHIAYFFLIAMRAAYKLNDPQNYEHWLLSLLKNEQTSTEIDQEIIQQKICDDYTDLLEKYSAVLSDNAKIQTLSIRTLDCIAIIKNMQNHDLENKHGSNYYLNTLFNMFWHGFSPINIQIPKYENQGDKITATSPYNLTIYDYNENTDPFLHQLALALYPHSFK